MAAGCTLFDTAIGRCGIAWSDRGIVAVQLPERDDDRTRQRLRRRRPDAVDGPPPAAVEAVIDDIVALLDGTATDLRCVELDLDGVGDFDRRVYEVARQVPPGETTTYGAVAARIGSAGAAREVGQSLGRNPFPIIVPCHRVVAADGSLGGFSANGGTTTKRRMLTIEGAAAAPPTLFADP